jgi:hypothetical protein
MWRSGKATHYGPFPALPHFSEAGYQAQDVGVGCSNGEPGGDPRWNKILNYGIYNSTQKRSMAYLNGSDQDNLKLQVLNNLETSVWPVAFTVAVSERAYGGKNKKIACFQTLKIRNSKNHSFIVEASIVDFCPSNGCLWKSNELANNLDLYGQALWQALGADLNAGVIEIDVLWPPSLIPNSVHHNSYEVLCLIMFELLVFLFA